MTAVFRFTLVVAVVLLAARVAVPQKPAAKPPAAKNSPPKLSAGEIQALVHKLESGKYQERKEASKQLMTAGKPAIAPVTKAARTDDLELGARCVDILKHFYKNGDAGTKTAAETALKQLKSSKHESVAKWAGDALVRPRVGNGNPFLPNRGGIRIIGGRIGGGVQLKRTANAVDKDGRKINITESFGPNGRQIVVKITEKVKGKDKVTEYKATGLANLRRKSRAAYDLYRKHMRGARMQVIGFGGNNLPIRIQMPQFPRVGGAQAGNRQISSTTVNGRRSLRAVENGRTVLISDSNGKDIVMSVTETKAGKAVTKSYKAKDVAELKKKHAEAAKIYTQYDRFGRQAGIQIQGFGGAGNIRLPRQALPVVPRRRPPQVVKPQRNANQAVAKAAIDKAKSQLDAAINKLQKLATQTKADPREIRQVASEIKQARAELERAKQTLK